MRRSMFYGFVGLVLLAGNGIASADEMLLPAGTLVRCTLDEPNFSSKTADAGDPVLCRLNTQLQFGRAVFPRGAYLMGHLEAYKDPGHFVGKGNLMLNFDRIGLPNTELPFSGKLVSVRGYRVNRQGEIEGHGHPRRDVAEWLLPPLWPWKVLTLPARGPRPTLKGEVPLTLRLMDTMVVSQVSDSSLRTPAKAATSTPPPQPFTNPSNSSVRYLPPTVPAAERQWNGVSAVSPAPLPAAESNLSTRRPPVARLTLLALKNETIYAATDYWIEDGRLTYILSDGTQPTADLSEVDWGRTIRLNSERGVRVALRNSRQTY